MRPLKLDEAQKIEGGSDCTAAVAAASIAVLAGALVTGPVGWMVLAAGGIVGGAAGVNVGVQCFT